MGNLPISACKIAVVFFLIYFTLNQVRSQQVKNGITQAGNDTILIKQLFGQGNQFFDGPSDSLIFYYNKAMGLIFQMKDHVPDNQRNTRNGLYKNLLRFHYQALLQLGVEHLLQGAYDQSLAYYTEALKVSEELQDISAISECYGEIGTLYNNQGNYELALQYQQKALGIARQMADHDWIAICNNNIGNVYKKKAFYSLALHHFIEALQWFEKTNQERRVAACYQNIGDVYYAQKNYDKALDYYTRTVQIAIESGNRQREADCYLLIGLVEFTRGKLKIAREYYLEALDLYESLGYRHGKDDCYLATGDTWISEGNWQKAQENLRQALEIAMDGNNKANIASAKTKLGLVYLKQKAYTQASEMFAQGLQIAIEIGSREMQMEANKLLAQLYDETNNATLALQCYKEYAALKDSLFSDSQYRIISEMEAIYEASKKEQNIALLSEKTRVQEMVISSRNRTLLAAGLFFMVSLLGGYFYIAYSKLKSQQKAVELENRLLRSQMNPHFIFNSLIAIQSYFYDHDPEKASDFLAKFADLIRMTLENSRVEFVLLDKELKMIHIYLELQALRFDDKFSFSITVDESVDVANICIPPMLVQPFIENAVEHGFRNKSEQGRLSIGFSKNGKLLMVTVEDNGIGRDASKKFLKGAEHLSLAVPMIKERLGIMSKKFRRKFGMEITDLYDPDGNSVGTCVEISMPWQV